MQKTVHPDSFSVKLLWKKKVKAKTNSVKEWKWKFNNFWVKKNILNGKTYFQKVMIAEDNYS